METVVINTTMIRLGQFLKMANLVGTGGEAKLRIQQGEVKVNGEVERRRGRQLRAGDLVEIAGQVRRLQTGEGQ
ncbi:RNA-binding S4 domain-containing protein [Desulfurivibrio sp. C05AmB]|uniref:RNA-binding S4 domain-containing protein n=1 Tax=Desulfurivibrio sp. C05AmB TaxID=3374371 RepID=UPI00376ED6F3